MKAGIADIAGTTVKKVAENAGDVVDKIDVSDAAGDAVGDAAGGILGEVLGGIIDNIL